MINSIISLRQVLTATLPTFPPPPLLFQPPQPSNAPSQPLQATQFTAIYATFLSSTTARGALKIPCFLLLFFPTFDPTECC